MWGGKQYSGEITLANVTKDILLYIIKDLMPVVYSVSKKQSKLVVQMNPFCIFRKSCICMHKQGERWGDTPWTFSTRDLGGPAVETGQDRLSSVYFYPEM